jgi:hypothetical protein
MQLRMSDEDREKFGCPEWLDVDLGRVTNRQAAVLQKAYGFRSLDELGTRFDAQFARAEDGTIDRAGLRYDYDTWDALVWLGLKRAGVDADLATLEYQVVGLRLRATPDEIEAAEAAAEGKSLTPTESQS